MQHDFPKMRGGSKDRLKLFQKFIYFGVATCPLVPNEHTIMITITIMIATIEDWQIVIDGI